VDEYTRDCHAGLVRWFTEFVCSRGGTRQALLDEIGEAQLSLNEGEHRDPQPGGGALAV
jgi:hypothetical protein